jgi:ECF sigma factor
VNRLLQFFKVLKIIENGDYDVVDRTSRATDDLARDMDATFAIRRVLIDRARRKQSLKRGGGFVQLELDDFPGLAERTEDILASK